LPGVGEVCGPVVQESIPNLLCIVLDLSEYGVGITDLCSGGKNGVGSVDQVVGDAVVK
jgi:hypothetical protein